MYTCSVTCQYVTCTSALVVLYQSKLKDQNPFHPFVSGPWVEKVFRDWSWNWSYKSKRDYCGNLYLNPWERRFL